MPALSNKMNARLSFVKYFIRKYLNIHSPKLLFRVFAIIPVGSNTRYAGKLRYKKRKYCYIGKLKKKI